MIGAILPSGMMGIIGSASRDAGAQSETRTMTTPPPTPEWNEPYEPSSPLFSTDPPKIGDFWLDSRLVATPSGVTYLAHDDLGTIVMLVLLSEGAADDAAARDRLAGQVNAMHIDTVVARGGHGQNEGRLGHKFRSEDDDPVAPGQQPLAPWVALAYDGTGRGDGRGAPPPRRRCALARLPQQGSPAGPDYALHWIDRIQPGLSRLWPLPWPGRHDRAGRISILASWLLMILIAMLAMLIAILMFSQSPPTSPPPPLPTSATTPPPSGSPPPESGSPPPSSASPSPSSGSPSPSSGSPSPSSGSPSPSSGSPSPSPSSGSPSPDPTATPSEAGAPTTNSRL